MPRRRRYSLSPTSVSLTQNKNNDIDDKQKPLSKKISGGVLTSKKIIQQELISLFPAAILTAGLMLLFRCLTADQARKAIMIDVYVCIAFAFAVSSAMEVSNVAQVFANGFAAVSRKIGGTTAPVVAIYMVSFFAFFCVFLFFFLFLFLFFLLLRARVREERERVRDRKNKTNKTHRLPSTCSPLARTRLLLSPLQFQKNTNQVAGLLTEIVTNNAAAALVYPVASRLGDALGVEPVVMASAVMLGASDAFVSPFGYQCNLMGEEFLVLLLLFDFFLVLFTIIDLEKIGEKERGRRAREEENEDFLVLFFLLHRCPALCLPHRPHFPLSNEQTSSSPPPVYAAGNYTTAQFIKYGIPLQLLQFATVTLIFILRPWKWILCGASVLLLVAVGTAIWVLQGDTFASLRKRTAFGKARKSGLFAEEKVGGANGAAVPKVA